MPSPENRIIPEWAREQRQADLAWIQENAELFQPAAGIAFAELGRGAIVVDTTVRSAEEAGHLFGYLSQEQLEAFDDEDTGRMVSAYDPAHELVIVLLKAEGRTSTYRIRPQWLVRREGGG